MKTNSRTLCALLLFLFAHAAPSAKAGYVVLMADTTPFFPLVYDVYEGFEGNRQFFRNLVGSSGGSVIVAGGSSLNPPFEFYQAMDGVSASFTHEALTDELLTDVKLVISDKRRQFTTTEARSLETFVRRGGNLFLGVEVNSPRGNPDDIYLPISAANSLLEEMGIGLSVVEQRLDAGYTVASGTRIRTHRLTQGVHEFGYGLTGRVVGGSPLFYTTDRVVFAAAVFVPEPATIAYAGTALLALAALRRRK